MTELTRITRQHDRYQRHIVKFAQGIRLVVHDRGDCWTSYIIIPRAVLIEGIRRRRARGAQYHDCDWWTLVPGLDRWVRPEGSGGPGRAFASEPWIERNHRYVIVHQSGGLDV